MHLWVVVVLLQQFKSSNHSKRTLTAAKVPLMPSNLTTSDGDSGNSALSHSCVHMIGLEMQDCLLHHITHVCMNDLHD